MSAHEARPEVQMPGQVIYREDHSGLRWQILTIVSLSWAALIVGIVASNQPHLEGFAVLAFVGACFGIFYTTMLWYTMAASLCVYEDSIQIGGLRGRDRRLRRGTWPPRKLSALSPRAVFICPWQATDGLYVVTKRSDINRIRQGSRQRRKRNGPTVVALGVLDIVGNFADTLLVISNDPRRTESEPRKLRPGRGRFARIQPVMSPTWIVPIRDPDAFYAAVQRLPQAPPVYDGLPEGHVRFEIS